MRVGDKLLCKKIVKHIHIKETKYYTITYIDVSVIINNILWFSLDPK